MALPPPMTNVDRAEVGVIVEGMLIEDEVGDVICEEQSNGKYTVTPQPH